MAMVEVHQLYKIFGSHPDEVLPLVKEGVSKEEVLQRTGHTVGLNDISLSIEAGATYMVMGLSGSGKSTLARCMNRLIEPTAGEIVIEGANIMALSRRELLAFRRRRMSMVFQHFGLLSHRTVMQNVAYGLEIQGVARQEREAKAQGWIDRVGLTGYEHAYPELLSGGMQQRVGLARALVTDPEILLMDEPFSALDPLIRHDMQHILLRLQKELHKTILFITHDLREALFLGDRIAILMGGVIIQEGNQEDILLHPADDDVADFVRGINRSEVLTTKLALTPPEALVLERDTPQVLVERIRNSDRDFAYITDQERHMLGIVTAEEAARIAGTGQEDVDEVLHAMPTVKLDAVLEEVLRQMLRHPRPLPVVDDQGVFQGVVTREKLFAILFGEDDDTSCRERG